jgi:hypothetical protein
MKTMAKKLLAKNHGNNNNNNDRMDSVVTIGQIDRAIFKLKSGKTAKTWL